MVGRTIIIGGGITGLSAAHQLHQQGDDYVLLEANQRLGGKIDGGPVAGSELSFDVDTAADGFLAREPEMAELCVELGLGDDLVSPVGVGAFVWVDGALWPIPQSVLGVPIDPDDGALRGILSPEGIVELRARGFADQPGLVGDATVGEVVRARAGDEVFERLVDPLLGGINAGNADNLSIAAGAKALAGAAHKGGPFIEALRSGRAETPAGPVFLGVKGGSKRIINALSDELFGHIHLNTPAVAIERHDTCWRVTTAAGHFDGDRVVITTSGFVSAALVKPHSPEAASLLGSLAYSDVVVVTFVVRREQLAQELNGAGFLVPRDQGLLMTACTWSSSKWAHYDDGTHAILRVSAGRIDDQRWTALNESALVDALHQELAITVGLDGEGIARVTPWPQSLPQYRPGHLQRCDQIDTCLRRDAPGVTVVGASMRGLGLPACVRQVRLSTKRP